MTEKFEDLSPCLYKGNILCKDCPRFPANVNPILDDGCDMAAGREQRREWFEKGLAINQAKLQKLEADFKELLEAAAAFMVGQWGGAGRRLNDVLKKHGKGTWRT